MRAIILFTLITLPLLSACQNIRDVDAVVVVSSDNPPPARRSDHPPPPHAPAHGRRSKSGPPPHAPAHGYRHQQENGMELVFDTSLGVYVVLHMVDMYYHDGLYLRFGHDGWQVRISSSDTWRVAREDEIPSKLRKSKRGKGWGREKERDRGRGRH